MSTPTPEVSWSRHRRHEKRLRAMIEDPDLTGDLLLVGIALARWVDRLVTVEKNPEGRYSWNDVLAGYLGGPGHRRRAGQTRSPWEVAWYALRDDVRRYSPDLGSGWSRPCDGPMVRRDGPCGKHGTHQRQYVDPDTGERFWRYACARHRQWLEDDWRRHRSYHPPDRAPTPPANAGGVLARHLPEVDWPGVYRHIDPTWTPPPERDPLPARPTLRLVVTKPTAEASS